MQGFGWICLVVAVFAVILPAEAQLAPSIETQMDTLGLVDYCPFDGTLKQLRQYGNRLLYEGKPVLAQACYMKAMHVSVDPTFAVRLTRQSSPLPRFREVDLFPGSSHMTNEHFDALSDVGFLIHRRTREALELDRVPSMPVSRLYISDELKLNRKGQGYAMSLQDLESPSLQESNADVPRPEYYGDPVPSTPAGEPLPPASAAQSAAPQKGESGT